MKFKLNRKDSIDLDKIYNQREYNIYMADLILDIINSNLRYFKGIDPKDIEKEFCKRLDIDDDFDFLFKRYFPNGLYKMDDKPYKENPYFKNIKVDNIKFKQYTLGYETYKPYEVFIADDYSIDDDIYQETPKIGYFENTHKFIALKENKVIWMSITPAETDTMIEHLDKVHGNIITFGLGLGYFQYMAARKDNVSHITIVDRDENIIELFKTHILPQFGEYKDKITIIHEDAYNCMNDFDKYDCVYVDLWHNPNDGLMFYMDFKKIENNFPNTEFYYWLEEGIIALIRRCLVSLIFEQETMKLGEKEYQKDEIITDKLINQFYRYTKNLTFNSLEEIKEFISKENILKTMKELD